MVNSSASKRPSPSLPNPYLFSQIYPLSHSLSSFYLDIENMFHNLILPNHLSDLSPFPHLIKLFFIWNTESSRKATQTEPHRKKIPPSKTGRLTNGVHMESSPVTWINKRINSEIIRHPEIIPSPRTSKYPTPSTWCPIGSLLHYHTLSYYMSQYWWHCGHHGKVDTKVWIKLVPRLLGRLTGRRSPDKSQEVVSIPAFGNHNAHLYWTQNSAISIYSFPKSAQH